MTTAKLNELMLKARLENADIFNVLQVSKRQSVRTFSKTAVRDLGSQGDYNMRKALAKALIQ